MCYHIVPDEIYTRHSEGAFLTLKDGSILFAYSRFHHGLYDESPCDIVSITSRDGGRTWSEAYILVSAEEFGVENVMSASLMRMQNGDVGLFYIVKKHPNRSMIMLSRSSDEGRTFYKHVECTAEFIPTSYVLNNDRAVRLESGRILLPLACHRGGVTVSGRAFYDYRANVAFLYSDDDGETWQSFPYTIPGAHNTVSGLQEPGVIELKSGVLWAYFRTDAMYQYESYSVDGGLRWTDAQPSRFTSPLSPMKIARDPETEALIAVWNPIPRYNGRKCGYSDRTPIVWAISRDDGRTWSEPVSLDDDFDRGYCYPAIHFLGNGEMLVSYCSGGPDNGSILGRTTIRRVRF